MGEYERWIKEFIDSERRYIDDLEVLSQHYKVICAEFNAAPSARLVNQIPEGLTKTEIQLIFQHTPSLLIFHQEIFPDLTKATAGPNSQHHLSSTFDEKGTNVACVWGFYDHQVISHEVSARI